MTLIRIEPLSSHPGAIRVLAGWHFAEWKHLFPDWSLEAVEEELASHLDPGRIPATFVAVDGGVPIGSVSLIVKDLPEWEHLTPWLASLYVRADRRGSGVGRLLVRHAIAEARRFEVTTLYLFTPGQRDYYSRLGWSVVCEAHCGKETVTIMSIGPMAATDAAD